MKSFKHYLREAELVDVDRHNTFGGHVGQKMHPLESAIQKHSKDPTMGKPKDRIVSTMKGANGTHYNVHETRTPAIKRPWRMNADETTYSLHDPKTGILHIQAKGELRKGGLNDIVLSSSGQSKVTGIRAEDFYHHLLKQGYNKKPGHPKMLVHSKQSEGGAGVLERLVRKHKSTISVNGYDEKTKKPVNVDPLNADETHSSEDEVNRHNADAFTNERDPITKKRGAIRNNVDQGPKHIKNMKLVSSYFPSSKLKAAKKG